MFSNDIIGIRIIIFLSPSWGSVDLTKGHALREEPFFLPKQLLLRALRLRVRWGLPPSMPEFGVAWPCEVLVQVTTATRISQLQYSCYVQKTLYGIPHNSLLFKKKKLCRFKYRVTSFITAPSYTYVIIYCSHSFSSSTPLPPQADSLSLATLPFCFPITSSPLLLSHRPGGLFLSSH